MTARVIGSPDCPLELCRNCRSTAECRSPALRVYSRVEVVDDVVGVAGEAVQGVHVGTFGPGQQAGGQVVGPAVFRVQPASVLVPRPAGRPRCSRRLPVPCARGVLLGRRALPLRCSHAAPVMRAAASFPEINTIGTPTPGCVFEPQKTRFSIRRSRVGKRNGPDWPNECAAANGAPAASPWLASRPG